MGVIVGGSIFGSFRGSGNQVPAFRMDVWSLCLARPTCGNSLASSELPAQHLAGNEGMEKKMEICIYWALVGQSFTFLGDLGPISTKQDLFNSISTRTPSRFRVDSSGFRRNGRENRNYYDGLYRNYCKNSCRHS